MPGRILLPTVAAAVVFIIAACSPRSASRGTGTAGPPSATATIESLTPEQQVGCSAVSAPPTPSGSSVIATITAGDYTRGPQNAPVTLLLYCDLQSAQCEIFNRVLDQLEMNHPDQLRVVLRLVPWPTSVFAWLDKSELAAQAALAAGNQGKFWELRDLLHSHYNEWANLPVSEFRNWITTQAFSLNLDRGRFDADLSSTAIQARVRAMYQSAIGIGISGTPTVFINGRLQERPALSYDGLEATIGLIALGARQFKACPPFDIDVSKEYVATLHTQKGDIVIRLYADSAPLAVNSFVFLARHGWYDGVTFHRVLPGFVAQTGDPSGTGRGGPGYFFKNEVRLNLLYDKPGVVGMANSGPDTNGSQFFITFAPEPKLDGSYTIFGQVVSGMDVVESLTPRDPQSSSALPPGDKIINVTIEEK